jgi:cardiolipin synthase
MAENGSAPGRTPPVVTSLAAVGAGFLAWCAVTACFTPRQRYHMQAGIDPTSDEFLQFLESTGPSQVYRGSAVQVLTDGTVFYGSMLEAIRGAERTINLEAFVMNPGVVTDAFTDALGERARAGVRVSIVLDAIGAKKMFGRPLARLKEAGCRLYFYQQAHWHRLARINNRTHRELLIIDGRTAFTGGPGIADYWLNTEGGEPPWRDTALRLEGPVVAALQGVFAENWLESSSEILAGDAYYPPLEQKGSTAALVFKSSPADRATVARVLFHSLIASARESIRISTPYFVPDRGMREALIRAAGRGVQVDVLVPGGDHADQPLLRVASRHWFGELLEGGVRLHEYRASMLHQKLLLVDRWWVVMGTTNVDNRSFEHNDEVNVAFPDKALAGHMSALYDRDLTQSVTVTLDAWRQRSIAERAASQVAWVLDRQQ